ncbi:MAG: YggT family protein [Acidimicrobiales bacterium]
MNTVCFLLNLYWLVILARMIMSWVRITPGTPVASVYSVIFSITEPVLGPLRRLIPPVRMGMAAIDVSPIIVIVVIILICSSG